MEINLNYVWAAMAVNFLLVLFVPRLIKKPTGFKIIDEAVLYLNTQKSFMLSSTLVIGLVMYLALYWVDSQSPAPVAVSPGKPSKF